MEHDIYKFEVNMAEVPNFYIKENTGTVDIPQEYFERYAEYIKRVVSVIDKDHLTLVSIYGGEPFKYFSKVKDFIKSLIGTIDLFSISSHGEYLEENLYSILDLYRELGKDFTIKMNWNEQIKNFGDLDTTNSFYYELYKLMARGITYTSTVRIGGNNISLLPDIFDSFVNAVENKSHDLNSKLFIYLSLNESDYSEYSSSIAREAIDILKQKMIDNPKISHKVAYKVSKDYLHISYDGSIMGNCYSCMCGDGTIYPGYDIPSMNEYSMENFNIGNVEENIDTLLDRRLQALEKKPTELPSMDEYHELFRSVPYVKFNEEGIDQYNVQPFSSICELHDLLKSINSSK